jgi:hypothetical protein
VQGDAGHPGCQGGGQDNNEWKKLRAEEEEERLGPTCGTSAPSIIYFEVI